MVLLDGLYAECPRYVEDVGAVCDESGNVLTVEGVVSYTYVSFSGRIE